MNRRQMLAGTAALPVAAFPAATHAELPVANGTDPFWPAYLDAKATLDAADAALDAADAKLPPEFRCGNLPTVLVQHGKEEPRKVFVPFMLEGERAADPIIARGLGGPEAVAARHAHYDRLAAELAERKAAYKEARRHIEPLYESFDELVEALNDAENPVLGAPILTLTDAVRKLEVIERLLIDSGDDMAPRVTLDVLAGLRRLTAAERLA